MNRQKESFLNRGWAKTPRRESTRPIGGIKIRVLEGRDPASRMTYENGTRSPESRMRHKMRCTLQTVCGNVREFGLYSKLHRNVR
jgi:hypothetical protein